MPLVLGRGLPDKGPARLKLVLNSPARFLILVLLAVVLRWSTFGDPDLAADETFYQTVGIAMHHGALPYVDVWDRKPLGLYILYYLIAGISASPLAYQLAATASAIATAAVIGRICRHWTGLQGALLAGCCYLVWLTPLFGFGGQSPVFYNLFIASAALLVLQALPLLEQGIPTWRVPLAMLLAGLGITIKTSALFEGVYFGLVSVYALSQARRGAAPVIRRAIGWALIGAAPSLAIAAYYAISGHWAEFWHAMVTANLAKGADLLSARYRLLLLLSLLAPLLLVAATGLVQMERTRRWFVAGWLLTAIIGIGAIPNFYQHYALPLLVVLCVAAGPILNRGLFGLGVLALLTALSIHAATPFRFGQAARSKQVFAALARAIRAHDGERALLVYAGPAQLYTMTGHSFPTPLAFETHLSQAIEKDVSHLSTIGEMQRVIAAHPGAVVLPLRVRNGPVIPETWSLVSNYVRANCHVITVQHAEDWLLADDLAVWGDCRP